MKSRSICRFIFTLKRIFFSSLLLFFTVFSFAQEQTGSIGGTVITSDGQPAELVNVVLKGTSKGSTADKTGHYTIANIKPGHYTVVASFTGLVSQSREVDVLAGGSLSVDFTLAENNQQLQEVVINSYRHNTFVSPKSEDVAKMPLKDLENAQVNNTVTSALIKEQQLTNFNDALRNVPGISTLFNNQAYGLATFSSRGFSVSANLRNGVSSMSNSDIDPANIEKIEVLKGPSATLFGSTLVSWGGLINRATKQPYDHFGVEAGYTGGSFGLSRFTADINSPLNKDTTLLFRVNAAHTYNGSFQDAGFSKSTFIAPVITYKPNDRLTISLEAEFYDREATTPFSIYVFGPMDIHSPKDLDLNYKRSFTSNDIKVASASTNFFGKVNYKLSNNWTSQTLVSTTNSPQKGPYLWSNFTTSRGDSILRTITDWNSVTNTTQIQQNFVNDRSWGSMRNRLVAGLDFFYNHRSGTYFYLPFDTVSVSNPGAAYSALTQAAITAREGTGQYGPNYNVSTSYTYAAYVSDVFNLTENLIFNAALRLDHFDNKGALDPVSLETSGNYTQTKLSPKFGLVYQPVKDQVSIFANYLNGFTNNDGTDASGKPFKASNGNQLEGGVKVDLLDHRVSATASYYRISANDLLQTDPANPGFSIQDGAEESKGFEISVITSPFNGFNLITGYSYNDTKYTHFNGAWLDMARNTAAGPAHTANAYASYHIGSGPVKGLGFGAGANYTSNYNIGIVLPAVTILNASVFYDRPMFRIGLRADNLSNREYWTGWNDMESRLPRNISVNVIVKL